LILLEDSRNKPEKNKHIRQQLEALGYKVDRCKLYVGDYSWATNQSVCIDTKQDLQEVVGNVIQQHDRFRAECVRAKEAGIKLIILIADPKIKTLSEVFGWYNPRLRFSKTATTGVQLGKILYSMREKYGVDFQFCRKDEIGKQIIRLLGGEQDEV
jgi:ERCC4-type nuclease